MNEPLGEWDIVSSVRFGSELRTLGSGSPFEGIGANEREALLFVCFKLNLIRERIESSELLGIFFYSVVYLSVASQTGRHSSFLILTSRDGGTVLVELTRAC